MRPDQARFDVIKDAFEEREAVWSPPGLGQHLVSEAQRRANQRNARKSTGPTSDAGRSRSGMNALRHGLYALTASAIPHGALKEDPLEVEDFLKAKIEALHPRDAMEFALAAEIARTILKLARIEAYNAQQLSSDGKPHAVLKEFGIDEPDEAVCRYLAQSAESLAEFLRADTSTVDEGSDYKAWAILIRNHKRKMEIRDLWTDEITPSTAKQWESAFRTLLKHCFPSEENALHWTNVRIVEFYEQLERSKGRRFEHASARAINRTFETVGRHRARALGELERLLRMYSYLQGRSLAPANGRQVGTNPISRSDNRLADDETAEDYRI